MSNNNNKIIVDHCIIFIVIIQLAIVVLVFLKGYFDNLGIIFQHKYIINRLQIIKMIHYINIQILFEQKKYFLNEYLHRYFAINDIIFSTFYFSKNTKNIAYLREHLYYPDTLNARKLLKISYNSMTYDQLRRFTSCFLTFKSNIVNLNVIPSEFKKFDGTEFRTLKIIVNNFTFIILCLKHIIYSLLSSFCSKKNIVSVIFSFLLWIYIICIFFFFVK